MQLATMPAPAVRRPVRRTVGRIGHVLADRLSVV